MAGATRTTADAVLQEDYLPPAREQLNNDVPLVNYAKRNTEDVEGRRAILSLHVGRNGGVGQRAEGGTLPTAGKQQWTEQRIPVFYGYGRLKVTGPLMAATKSDKASFVRATASEMEGLTADLARDKNRQLWGNGTGLIVATGLTSNTTVINLAATATDTQVRQLEVDMVVDIGLASDPDSDRAGATISAIDDTTGAAKITINTASSTTASGFVSRAGNGGVVGTDQKEVTGLQLIVDSTGTVFNVNPTTYPAWKSVEKGNSGTNRQVSETLLGSALQAIQISGGGWPDLGFASSGVHLAISSLLTSLKRFPNTRTMAGGYEGLDFAASGPTVTITWDRDCPANSLYFVNSKHLIHFVSEDWQWMDQDGAILSRVSGEDAYEAVMFCYDELATDKRNAHGKVVDITEAS